MRAPYHRLTWVTAAIALIIATPVQAAAGNRSPTQWPATASTTTATTTSVQSRSLGQPGKVTTPPPTIAVRTAVTEAFSATSIPSTRSQDTGRGWAELYCMACVGLGTLALYSGGITMLPVMLANPAAFSTMTGTCVLACESAIKTLLK
jgi:hypothetical protein